MTIDLTARTETGMDKTPNAVLGGTDDGRLRIHCPACEWDAVYGCLDLVSIQAVVREHLASHAETFEDGSCRFCGLRLGNHKFECANAPEPRRLSDGFGPLKRTAEYWCDKYGVQIHDPDGWRMPDAPAWDEPITLADFYRRASKSTTNAVSVDWGRIAREAGLQ